MLGNIVADVETWIEGDVVLAPNAVHNMYSACEELGRLEANRNENYT